MYKEQLPSSPRVGGRMHMAYDDLNHAIWQIPYPDSVIQAAALWNIRLYSDGIELGGWVDHSTIADDDEKRDRYATAAQSFFKAAQYLGWIERELKEARIDLDEDDLQDFVGDRVWWFFTKIEELTDSHVPYQARYRFRRSHCEHDFTPWYTPSYPCLEEHRDCRKCGLREVEIVET